MEDLFVSFLNNIYDLQQVSDKLSMALGMTESSYLDEVISDITKNSVSFEFEDFSENIQARICDFIYVEIGNALINGTRDIEELAEKIYVLAEQLDSEE